MNESDLEYHIGNSSLLKSKFRGIFSCNDFPKNPEVGFYIVNTDPDYLPGTHWVAVYIKNVYLAYYFDSLAQKPLEEIDSILLNNGIAYQYTIKRLQGMNSTVCGDYCLVFGYIISMGYDLNFFISIFGSDYEHNDSLIKL